jgi:hypothetical protein
MWAFLTALGLLLLLMLCIRCSEWGVCALAGEADLASAAVWSFLHAAAKAFNLPQLLEMVSELLLVLLITY